MTGDRSAPTAVGIVGIFCAASDGLLDRSGIRAPWHRTAAQLFRRRLHLVVEVNVILLVERLVAVEAGAEIGGGVHALVRLEDLVLPLAVAHVVRVLGAPARAL